MQNAREGLMTIQLCKFLPELHSQSVRCSLQSDLLGVLSL